ncbi:MAG: MFS transporter [Haliea sp.]|nr:MFS transporter [Haliea sp.]|tara:strand:+ start:95534 stop:96883 length:1350 start_codon:yes stop_codon:yes gene_type:complete
MSESHAVSDDYPASGVAWRVTLLLTVAYMLSFVDRQVVNLLVDPIQADLQISDTQVSLLQGFAFIITYILFSIPLGRLADTHSRKFIVAGGVFFWSLATAACGLANSFKQLFVARAAVGMGEAALTPAAWSMMADYFPPERRSFPVSIFLMGPYLGAGLSMIAGGAVMGMMADMETVAVPLLGEFRPWQVTFMLVGLPGVLVAALFLRVMEPARKVAAPSTPEPVDPTPAARPDTRDVVAVLREKAPVYAALLIAIPLLMIVLYGLQAWVPSLLVRSFAMSVQDAGLIYGLVALFSGSAGVLSGPVVGRWLDARGVHDYPLRLGLWSCFGVCPALLVVAMAPAVELALLAVIVASVLVTLPLALAASTLQTITPGNMRGLIAGMYVVMTSGVGMGLGPTLIALCTDFIVQDRTQVGWSLAIVGLTVAAIAAVLFLRALAPYRRLLERPA